MEKLQLRSISKNLTIPHFFCHNTHQIISEMFVCSYIFDHRNEVQDYEKLVQCPVRDSVASI